MPIYNLTGGGSSSSATAAMAIDVEVVTASQAATAYGNGIEYIPLIKGGADSIEFQFRSPATGNINICILYAMSAANAGNIQLRLDSLIVSDSEDPSAALSTGTAFIATPGNDTNKHTINEVTSTQLQLSLTINDLVRCKLVRTTDVADTHTGDVRIMKITAVKA